MNTNKMTVIFIFVVFFQCCILAQGDRGFYGYINTGYKFGSVYTTFPNMPFLFYNDNDYTYTRAGGGYSFTASGGWMFHPNFGMEISNTITEGLEKTINNNLTLIEYSNLQSIHSHNSHVVGSFVAQTKIGKCFIYAKAGIVLSYINQTIFSNYEKWLNTTNLISSYKLSAELMRGFNGSLGLLIPISSHWNLMVELEEVSVQGSLKEGHLNTNNYYNGIIYPTTIHFVDNPSNFNSTTDELYQKTIPISYSCIGANVGVLYKFGTKK